jgi:hypothetical protein
MDFSKYNTENLTYGKLNYNPYFFSLTVEEGKNIYNYLKSINLSNDNNLMILPPNNHYFYFENEFKGVSTLINLEKLNQIKHLNKFLHNLFKILPPNANLIGCFSEDKDHKDNNFTKHLSSILFSKFINYIDNRTFHVLNKNIVSNLLEVHGFKIMDISEVNGLNYFYAKSNLNSAKSRPGAINKMRNFVTS